MSALTRRRPFYPMQSLHREIDRLFGEFFPTFGDEGGRELSSAVWAPRMDMSETDTEFVVKLDLPGLEKDQVNVSVEDGQLVISGEREAEQKEETESYLWLERSSGSFYRSVALPSTAKVDKVNAKFKNGVLTVRIPKVPELKPKKVEIA